MEVPVLVLMELSEYLDAADQEARFVLTAQEAIRASCGEYIKGDCMDYGYGWQCVTSEDLGPCAKVNKWQ